MVHVTSGYGGNSIVQMLVNREDGVYIAHPYGGKLKFSFRLHAMSSCQYGGKLEAFAWYGLSSIITDQ